MCLREPTPEVGFQFDFGGCWDVSPLKLVPSEDEVNMIPIVSIYGVSGTVSLILLQSCTKKGSYREVSDKNVLATTVPVCSRKLHLSNC